MIYKMDQYGQVEDLLKIQSTSYAWRSDMRDTDPNLTFRFYQLANESHLRVDHYADAATIYRRKFPLLTKYNVGSIIDRIKKDGPFIVWPQEEINEEIAKELIRGPTDRLSNIWRCFLMSVPLHRQLDVAHMFDRFIRDREDIITWIINMEDRTDLAEDPDIPNRVHQILELARGNAAKKTEEGKNRDRRGRSLSVKALTGANVRNLIMKENGRSLYKLMKSMKEHQVSLTQEIKF